MELRWEPRASHGRKQPPELCRPMGGRKREREREKESLNRTWPPWLRRSSALSLQNEENNQRKIKETLDAPKENDLTKWVYPYITKWATPSQGLLPPFIAQGGEGNTTCDSYPSFHTFCPTILRTGSHVARRSSAVFSQFLLVAGILLDTGIVVPIRIRTDS